MVFPLVLLALSPLQAITFATVNESNNTRESRIRGQGDEDLPVVDPGKVIGQS
jgi:hypothetical protein